MDTRFGGLEVAVINGKKFEDEDFAEMDVFLERLIEQGLSGLSKCRNGVARDYAEEVIDWLTDAKIELAEARIALVGEQQTVLV